jgi:hypothetical protein
MNRGCERARLRSVSPSLSRQHPGRETYAEVAQETIFRRWGNALDYCGVREFRAWKTGLEAAYRSWEATEDRSKNDAC